MSAGPNAGFFTHGVHPDRYHLPHPPLGLPVILLIRRVLLRAFELLREQGFDLANQSEDRVTAALRGIVESRLRTTGEVRGFGKRTYETVIRQGQWANYNNKKISKAPDLFFKLRDDNSERGRVLSEFDGLFIEAKPVDAEHAAGGKYCDDGLIRFVRGDYAWAMQEGVMLAYARDGRSIARHLLSAMQEPRPEPLGILLLPRPAKAQGSAAVRYAEAVHVSQHRRTFPWPDGKGEACTITIYHLWHDCAQRAAT